MKKIILSLLFVTCVFFNQANATTLVTLERRTIIGIAHAMGAYQIWNQGQLPANWAQIREIYDLEKIDKALAGQPSSYIEDRYQFITQPLPTLDGKAQVLIIRTVPLAHLDDLKEEPIPIEKQWRYVVLKGTDGKLMGTRLPEKEIQKMLTQADVTITPKRGLAAVETDDRIPGTEVRHRSAADIAYEAQHPELDPSKNAATPPARPTTTHETQHAPATAATPESSPVTEAQKQWPIWTAVIIAVLGILAVIIYRKSRK